MASKFKQSDILFVMQTYSNDKYTFEMREVDIIHRLRSMYKWVDIKPREVIAVLRKMANEGILKARGFEVNSVHYFITSSKYLL